MTNKTHWERVYASKGPSQVSWTQEVPRTSLEFIHSFGMRKNARIIDVGGGDSKLVDFLLNEGYENITVLDISEKALTRARNRLGRKAAKVKWVSCDITDFNSDTTYDIWHDRATFHFLTTKGQVTKYLDVAQRHVDRYMVIGTFLAAGPSKCSGLQVRQYDERCLTAELDKGFEKLKCITEDHITPFYTRQNFLFCGFKRKFK